jgi:predicted DCC family thiol-disulfide oxidoreductase YuxK
MPQCCEHKLHAMFSSQLIDGSHKETSQAQCRYRSQMNAPLTVWYNTRCPVCDYGINRQKRRLIEAVRSGAIEFRDINGEPDALSGHGATLEEIRRRLHAIDGSGNLLAGADVAIAIWRLTPGEGWIGSVLGNWLTLPATRFFYNRFADLLYAWNRRRGSW